MLFYLLHTAELQDIFHRLGYPFDADRDLRANVEYYAARTSHGSTLSWVVHAWVLARLDRRRSWQLFLQALRSDIADIQGGTTHEGIHLGAMAGTVDLIQRCYGGVEARDGVLRLDPALPDDRPMLRFLLHYRGHRVDVVSARDRLQMVLPALAPPGSVTAATSSSSVAAPPRSGRCRPTPRRPGRARLRSNHRWA